jgi:hypothetical protein
VNTDLLQARIRQQAAQLTESQREVERTKSELEQSRVEAAQLRAELSEAGGTAVNRATVSTPVNKVHIFPLASGGLNKDESPGDDAVVVQFAPLDRNGDSVKQSGDVQIVLLDPRFSGREHELGRWEFTAEECQKHWTRGISSSGYQFTLPLEVLPRHPEVVIDLRFKTADQKQYQATQSVKVAVAAGHASISSRRANRKLVQAVNDDDVLLPPVGVDDAETADGDVPDWAQDPPKETTSKPGHTVLHSANWIKDSVPVVR